MVLLFLASISEEAVSQAPLHIGKVIGVFIWGFFLIQGIVKCFRIARRETTSALCAYALACSLLAWLLGMIFGVVNDFIPLPAVKLIVTSIGLFQMCVLALVAVVLAIVGLAKYNAVGSSYVQGRKQAGWAIAIVVIQLLLVVAGVVSRFSAQRLVSQMPVGKGVYEFPEENFSLTDPSQSWVEFNAESLNPDCDLMLRRIRPEMYIQVVAEQIGVESDLSSEQLMDISQSNIKLNLQGAEFGETASMNLSGVEGVYAETKVKRMGMVLDFGVWCHASNGYAYQVITWCHEKDVAEARLQIDEIRQGFHILDPDKVIYSTSSGAFGIERNPEQGYALDLSDSDWYQWDSVKETDSRAECGAIHPSGVRFTITTLDLTEQEAEFGFVEEGLFNAYSIEEVPARKVLYIDANEVELGYAYSYDINSNKVIDQLIRSGKRVHLMSVWVDKESNVDLEALVKEISAGLTLMPTNQSVDRASWSEEKRTAQSELINYVGLAYYNAGRYRESKPLFLEAVRLNPDYATYSGNVLGSCVNMKEFAEGLEFEAKLPDAVQKDEGVIAWKGDLLELAGKNSEADELYTGLFEGGYRSDTDLQDWLNVRFSLNKTEDLKSIIDQYGQSKSVLLEHLADHYVNVGEYAAAEALAEHSIEQYGLHEGIGHTLINARQSQENYRGALDCAEHLISNRVASVAIYKEKAVSEYNLKWYRKSKATFEQALKLNPKNESIQEWLEHVSSVLGEGNNSLLKTPIKPVELPEELVSRTKTKAEPDFGAVYGARYDQMLHLWEFEKDKMLKKTRVDRITVLDTAGISAFSSLEYGFDPSVHAIYVNSLKVNDGQGKRVAEGAVRDYYVIDDKSTGLVSEDKLLVIPVPNLQPGYSIEVQITKEWLGDPDEFYFDRTFLAANYPSQYAAVYLTGSVSQVKAEIFNGIEAVDGANHRYWESAEPVSYRKEPCQVSVERILPMVILSSADSSWKQCGNIWFENISERLGILDTVKARALQVVEGVEGDEAKAEALINYVRKSYVYKPLEFGRSAYLPDLAADTLRYRYGDCKDLSVLLRAMLVSVGVEADLVLCNTSYRVQKSMPNSGQFNHMIVYLPTVQGGLFVDPTNQESPAFQAVPIAMGSSKVLILRDANSEIIVTPGYPKTPSRCVLERRVVPNFEKNEVAIKEHITVTDYYATFLRSTFRDLQKIKHLDWVRDNLCCYVSGLTVQSVVPAQLDELDKPLIFEISYVYTGGVTASDEGFILNVPSVWSRYYCKFTNVKNRRNPFGFTYPFELEVQTIVETPDGYSLLEEFAPEKVSGKHSAVSWSLTSEEDSRTGLIQLAPGTYAANDYAEFVKESEQGVLASEVQLLFKKSISSPSKSTSVK